MTRSFKQSYRFFLENAGGVVGLRAVTAWELAKAEEYAAKHDWSCQWCAEEVVDDSWMEPGQKWNECLCCVLKDTHGNILDSLGMIFDPDRNYIRLVEAELALEAITDDLRRKSTFGIGKAA